MAITGKQVSAGVEIMRILLANQPRGRSLISDIIDNAPAVAALLSDSDSDKDIDAISKAIVERMVTIKAEVS
jgi:hypothetical protein